MCSCMAAGQSPWVQAQDAECQLSDVRHMPVLATEVSTLVSQVVLICFREDTQCQYTRVTKQQCNVCELTPAIYVEIGVYVDIIEVEVIAGAKELPENVVGITELCVTIRRCTAWKVLTVACHAMGCWWRRAARQAVLATEIVHVSLLFFKNKNTLVNHVHSCITKALI